MLLAGDRFKRVRTWTIALLGVGALAAGCVKRVQPGTAVAPIAEVSPLRGAASVSPRKIGVALATWFFPQEHYQEFAAHHFDSMTPENEMKWYAVEPEPDKFQFGAGDKLVDFAEKNRMRVRGHTLVWHSQLAAWAKTLSGPELHAAMIRHATKTVEHWKGRIAQWDVVNEALGDDGTPRAESPFTALWPTYVDDAFRAAHAADPRALLFYNDYDIEHPKSPKTEAAYALVKRLKESGMPIHGVGFQMHLDPRHMSTSAEIRQTLERFAALDLAIELTEFDLPVGALQGTLEQKLAQQAELTRGVVGACLAVPRCTGITLWGLSDKQSWLKSAEWAPLRGPGPHLPLPFDENLQPKPMYRALFETLKAGPHTAAPAPN